MAHGHLLKTAEVAERLRVSISTVNNYARTGRLAAVELPLGQRRFYASDVDAFLREGQERAEARAAEAAS